MIGWTTALISPRAVSVQVARPFSLVRRTSPSRIDRLTSFFDIPGPIAGLGAVPDSAGQEWFVCADSEFSVADIPPYSYPGE